MSWVAMPNPVGSEMIVVTPALAGACQPKGRNRRRIVPVAHQLRLTSYDTTDRHSLSVTGRP
jgi:hypothetical protein